LRVPERAWPRTPIECRGRRPPARRGRRRHARGDVLRRGRRGLPAAVVCELVGESQQSCFTHRRLVVPVGGLVYRPLTPPPHATDSHPKRGLAVTRGRDQWSEACSLTAPLREARTTGPKSNGRLKNATTQARSHLGVRDRRCFRAR